MSLTVKFDQIIVDMLSTNEFAERVRLKPQTIRKSLSKNGHVMGIRPIKLPNGKLRWKKHEVAALLNGDK